MNEFFQMLKKEHREVVEILGQLEETENKSKKRDDLFQKLTEALVPHMKAEEISFYAPLLAKKEAREVALEGSEEHHIKEEEGMIFKTADEVLNPTAYQNILKQFVEEKQKVKEGLLKPVAVG